MCVVCMVYVFIWKGLHTHMYMAVGGGRMSMSVFLYTLSLPLDQMLTDLAGLAGQ